MSSNIRTAYVQARERLLTEITESLLKDERFVAAWLAGSFGRGEQTWQSDLDIHIVVANEYSESLCAVPWLSGARTTPERLALFSQFGTPAIIFDAHGNNFMFWMIAASNVQNLLDHQLGQFHVLLMWLEESIREVQAALKGEHAPYTKVSRVQLYTTQEEQVAALRGLCDEMEQLMPVVAEMGGYLPANPRAIVEKRLALLAEA